MHSDCESEPLPLSFFLFLEICYPWAIVSPGFSFISLAMFNLAIYFVLANRGAFWQYVYPWAMHFNGRSDDLHFTGVSSVRVG